MTDKSPTDTTTTDKTRSAPSNTGRTKRAPRAARKTAKTTSAGKTTRTAARATAAEPGSPKAPTKLDKVMALLARPEGASIDELCTATGWQAHSVRGAMAGALKKKGHVITSEKHDGVRRYRTGAAA